MFSWHARYKDTVVQEVQKALGLNGPPVWKQSKDHLKEEGITVEPQGRIEENSDEQVQVVNGCKQNSRTGFLAELGDKWLVADCCSARLSQS